MPTSCVAIDCTSRRKRGSGLRFLRFPVNKERRKLWITAIRRKNWAPCNESRICGKHFLTGSRVEDPTHPDYVPSLFTFKDNTAEKRKSDLDRFCRTMQRRARSMANKPTGMEHILSSVDTNTITQLHCDDSSVYKADTQINNGIELLQNVDKENTPISTSQPVTSTFIHSTSTLEPFANSFVQTEFVNADIECLFKENKSLTCDVILLEAENKTLKLEQCRYKAEYEALKQEVGDLKKTSDEMKLQLLEKAFGFHTIEKSPAGINFFTGISNCTIFMWLLNFVQECLSSPVVSSTQKLSARDQLLLVLMKLRLGLSNRDLGWRFKVCERTVTNIFTNWISALAAVSPLLIPWPNRKSLRKSLPNSFKPKFGNVSCIIDCTEFLSERPSSLTPRAQTWSSYKHSNSLKVLIAISPAGAITFISECWGGRVSDKELVLQSGFLQKLLPGDTVLADRGFLLHDELAAIGCKLITPAFTKGKKQLSPKEVDESREMSRLRIHVERVIGVLKQFTILHQVFPVQNMYQANEIIQVCGALTNLRKSVVPKG